MEAVKEPIDIYQINYQTDGDEVFEVHLTREMALDLYLDLKEKFQFD